MAATRVSKKISPEALRTDTNNEYNHYRQATRVALRLFDNFVSSDFTLR